MCPLLLQQLFANQCWMCECRRSAAVCSGQNDLIVVRVAAGGGGEAVDGGRRTVGERLQVGDVLQRRGR